MDPFTRPPCRQERRRRKEKEERRKKRKTSLTVGTTFCMQSPRAAHALRLNARRSCSIPQFASCFPLPGFSSLPFRFPSSLVFRLSYFFLYIFSSLDLVSTCCVGGVIIVERCWAAPGQPNQPQPSLCPNILARGSSPAVVAGRRVKRPNYVLPWNSGSMLPDYKMGAIKRVMITHPNFSHSCPH